MKKYINLMLLFIAVNVLSEEKKISIELLRNQNLSISLEEIAILRERVFKEFPYLFDAKNNENLEYLFSIANSKNSIIIVAKDNNKIIGALTAIPLEEVHEFFLQSFLKAKKNYSSIFFIDEIMIDDAYRKKGIGKKMYQYLEGFVRATGKYESLALLQIVRSEHDPRKPLFYQPSSPFWEKMGFTQDSRMRAFAYYKEINMDKKKFNPMVYSFKELN